MSLEELSESFKRDGLKAFRAAQVYEWLTKGAESFDEMTNLSKDLRSALSEKYFVAALKIRKNTSQKSTEPSNIFLSFPTGALSNRL